MPHLRTRAGTLLVAVLASASCSERIVVCEPGYPGCVQPVVEVTVASSVDSVMAVDRTAQLNATAIDPRGNPIADVTFSWTSTDLSTAIVDGTGVVLAREAGTTEFIAEADGVTGAFPMRVLQVDLEAVDSTLTESFVRSMFEGLDPPAAASLAAVLSDCSVSVDAGHLLAVDQCLSKALGTTGVSGHDTALLAVLELFLLHAKRQLRLEG